jgi:hypothetical protein
MSKQPEFFTYARDEFLDKFVAPAGDGTIVHLRFTP